MIKILKEDYDKSNKRLINYLKKIIDKTISTTGWITVDDIREILEKRNVVDKKFNNDELVIFIDDFLFDNYPSCHLQTYYAGQFPNYVWVVECREGLEDEIEDKLYDMYH